MSARGAEAAPMGDGPALVGADGVAGALAQGLGVGEGEGYAVVLAAGDVDEGGVGVAFEAAGEGAHGEGAANLVVVQGGLDLSEVAFRDLLGDALGEVDDGQDVAEGAVDAAVAADVDAGVDAE